MWRNQWQFIIHIFFSMMGIQYYNIFYESIQICSMKNSNILSAWWVAVVPAPQLQHLQPTWSRVRYNIYPGTAVQYVQHGRLCSRYIYIHQVQLQRNKLKLWPADTLTHVPTLFVLPILQFLVLDKRCEIGRVNIIQSVSFLLFKNWQKLSLKSYTLLIYPFVNGLGCIFLLIQIHVCGALRNWFTPTYCWHIICSLVSALDSATFTSARPKKHKFPGMKKQKVHFCKKKYSRPLSDISIFLAVYLWTFG